MSARPSPARFFVRRLAALAIGASAVVGCAQLLPALGLPALCDAPDCEVQP